ncbi:uncharacterized protein LOC118408697 [Branchiostoma floridae]|uniref:Uncharacterized protein LOC118408697 n=1 Tax=Branchiostoma floridae TaxID=7739 RepID=A0A9J7HVU1_BRAFL|nr:uncharacterized protein LOC118408697 [Branchiostoma floridae]
MAGTSVTLLLLAVLVGIALPTAAVADTPGATGPDKPCGDFTWPKITNGDVKCDYSYYNTGGRIYDYPRYRTYNGPFSGRCKVNCSGDIPVIGPISSSLDGPHEQYYYCHEDSGFWLGTEPRCEGKYFSISKCL